MRCDATRRQQTAGKEPHLGDRVTSFLHRPGTGGELASIGRRRGAVPLRDSSAGLRMGDRGYRATPRGLLSAMLKVDDFKDGFLLRSLKL